jgi:hypothetical protein
MNRISSQTSKLIFESLEKNSDLPLTFFKIYKNERGTRFTKLGYELASKSWRSYLIKLPQDYKILNRTLLMLDQRMQWPYYLSRRKLVLFSELDAFEFNLYQGDVNLWANKT